MIVATPPETHYGIAKVCLGRGLPVLVEKPITLHPDHAQELVAMGGIAFAGHTRLYSPAWRAFKDSLPERREVQASAADLWDWGPHVAAMCLDLGVTPDFAIEGERYRFAVNGVEFCDADDNPLEVLIAEFVAAIALGKPNNQGLRLGAEVVNYLWRRSESRGLHGT